MFDLYLAQVSRPDRERDLDAKLERRRLLQGAVSTQTSEPQRVARRVEHGTVRVLGRGRRRTPEQGVQPDPDLVDLERLGEVVVAAGLEAGDLVVQPVARGQEQHRRVDAGGAQGQAEVAPVGVRETDVEHQHVGAPGHERTQRLGCGRDDHRLVSHDPEGAREDRTQCGFVLTDTDDRHIRSVRVIGRRARPSAPVSQVGVRSSHPSWWA